MVKKQKTKSKSSKLKCVWNMGTSCNGLVEEKKLFNKQIKVPICEKHIQEHKEVMILHKNGYDVEDALNQTPEWRKKQVLLLELSEVDTDEIEL